MFTLTPYTNVNSFGGSNASGEGRRDRHRALAEGQSNHRRNPLADGEVASRFGFYGWSHGASLVSQPWVCLGAWEGSSGVCVRHNFAFFVLQLLRQGVLRCGQPLAFFKVYDTCGMLLGCELRSSRWQKHPRGTYKEKPPSYVEVMEVINKLG